MQTVREHLAETYPQHFQRIVECIYASSHFADIIDAETHLSMPFMRYGLTAAFLWSDTTEGWEYWSRLNGTHEE